ncbi:MAG: hypothetical protein LBM93_01685 [Oscillospiraceae bacterium]|nr:hypothetical protein [Oscillospiraceae bacterium]
MGKHIWNVFKVCMISVIMMVVVSTVTYVQQVYAVTTKVESLMTLMKIDVAQNNGLDATAVKKYGKMFEVIYTQMGTTVSDLDGNSQADNFLVDDDDTTSATGELAGVLTCEGWYKDAKAFKINYGSSTQADADTSVAGVHRNLAAAGNFGDIMLIQVKVNIRSLRWAFGAVNTADGAMENAVEGNLGGTQELVFEYMVPCLKYVQY